MNYEYDRSRQPIAQGDVMLVPIIAIPAGATPLDAENGAHIITHSETGHHHVVMDRPDIRHYSGMDVFTGFLSLGEAALLEHLRDHHTHVPISLEPGHYVIKRQRQPAPEGWRRAVD